MCGGGRGGVEGGLSDLLSYIGSRVVGRVPCNYWRKGHLSPSCSPQGWAWIEADKPMSLRYRPVQTVDDDDDGTRPGSTPDQAAAAAAPGGSLRAQQQSEDR